MSAPRTARRWRWHLLSHAIGLLVVLPLAAGLLGVLLPAFGYLPPLGAREPGLHVIALLAEEPGIWRSIRVSAVSGFGATVLSLTLTALILAAAFGTPALRIAERLLAPILSVPHAAAALGFVFLFAPSGFLLRLVSPVPSGLTAPPDVAILQDPAGFSLMVALTVKETPFLFLMALAALGQVRAGERLALARTLGYGRMAAFLFGVFPLVYRQLRLPVLAVLAFSVSVVDMALILGPTRPPPLAVRILAWLQAPDLDGWLTGSAAALAMLALVAVLVGVWLALERLAAPLFARLATAGLTARRDGAARALVLAAAFLGVAAALAGVAGLVAQSFAGYWPFPDTLPRSWSAAAWQSHLPLARRVLGETLAIALGAMALALPLAVALLEAGRRGAPVWWLIYTPLLVPQVAFLFGLDVLAIAAGVAPGLLAVTLAHTLFTLPYALIALSGPWAALDPRYEALAASLGAGPWRRLLAVRLPLMVRPLAIAAALSVAVSVGLYLPTLMIGGGRVVTATTEAVTAASAGDRRLIGLFATMQLVLPVLAFTLARGAPRLSRRLRRIHP